jgi:hypothetical protein
MIKVLAVDDEPQILRAMRVNLTARQFEVSVAATGRAALKHAAVWHPDVSVLDLGLPDLDGVDDRRSRCHGRQPGLSITIVALTLASSQFGPRMLRNFIRDRTTQLTLGTYVATFVYAVLALGSIGPAGHGDFVPHLSITVALALLLVDVGLLILFIHRIAMSIQSPRVSAGIAEELVLTDPSADRAGTANRSET